MAARQSGSGIAFTLQAIALTLAACSGESRLSLLEPNEAPAPELRPEQVLGAAGQGPEVSPPSPIDPLDVARDSLALRYDFEGEGTRVVDRVGYLDGVLYGDARLDAQGGVELDGDDDYVDIPNGVLSRRESATIMAWLEWRGGYCWQRVFDFGSNDAGEDRVGNATSSLFLTPASCPAQVVMSMTEQLGEQRSISASRSLPIDRTVQVALVIDGEQSAVSLYIDGTLEATSALAHPLAELDDVNNWLGRSQWVQDANLRARYDELRIYGRALDAEDVAALYDRGADQP